MRYLNVRTTFKIMMMAGLLFTSATYAGSRMQGDAGEGAATTFSFSVDQHCMTPYGDYLFVGARFGATDTKDYALSLLKKNTNIFSPITPQTITLDGKAEQVNPLFDKTVQNVVFLERLFKGTNTSTKFQYPVAVEGTAGKTASSLYVFSSFTDPNKVSLISATNIKDASTTNVTGGIEGIATAGNCIFAAVKPNTGAFGDANGGIALLLYGEKSVETGEVDEEGNPKKKVVNIIEQKNIAALNKASSLVKINGDLESLEYSDMHWDPILGVLYIALKVKSAANVGDGARAIVVGTINKDNQLVLKNIAPDTAFGTGEDEIVGTGVAEKKVEIRKVRTMYTTTWLNYLIVQGSNVLEDLNQNKHKEVVYALPIVNNYSHSTNHGILAKFDAIPVDVFSGDKTEHSVFQGRCYITPAAQNADVLKLNSSEAFVGRGPVPGVVDVTIIDMVVKGDTVFVLVEESFTGGQIKKRIYYSRAIFDNLGRISGWTVWQSAKASEGKIFGFEISSEDGTVVTLESDGSSNAVDVKSVYRSMWGSGDETGLGDLTTLLSKEFSQDIGGIHGLFDFSKDYPATENSAFMVATGFKKIALIETERNNLVNKGNFSTNMVSFDNGTVTQTFGGTSATQVVVISGGALDDIGPINCVELAFENDTPSTRIFVGGPGGLAVLVGNGNVGIAGKLKPGFEGIVAGMAFAKIGNYAFVKKLIVDSDFNFLYVLTDTQLDRINLEDAALPSETIARVGDGPWKVGATFNDLIIAWKLAILATDSGVFRTDNGKDITSSPLDMAWKKLEQPGISGPAQKLFAVPHQGLVQSLQYGGNLEVLNAYLGKNRGKLSRFLVEDVSGNNKVTDTTFQALPDGFIQKREGGLSYAYFANYGTFRNRVFGDGAFGFSSRERDITLDPTVRMFGPGLRSGMRLASTRNSEVILESDASPYEASSDIAAIVRGSSSGDIFVAMDSGLYVNE